MNISDNDTTLRIKWHGNILGHTGRAFICETIFRYII